VISIATLPRLLAFCVSICAVVESAVPAHAAPKYQPMTIHAAVQLCSGSHHRTYDVAVHGFFRPAPPNHGPFALDGALFDSDKVPADAAQHVRVFHGLNFAIGDTSRLGTPALVAAIRKPHASISVRGVLWCLELDISPVSISVRRSRAPTP